MSEEQIEKSANDLVKCMHEAVDNDNIANANGKPALNKLMLLDQVCRDLRKLAI
jgi:hypothetical protein